jgi:hypothetical protein
VTTPPPDPEQDPGPLRRWWVPFLFPAVLALVAGILFATGPPWWTSLFHDDSPANHEPSGPAGFVGGCKPYQVYAQNRWAPLGATVRSQPNVLSTSMTTFPGNMSLSVNGWVHGRAAYPTNTPPFDNDIWFHLTDGIGWVSFGGVRALPTSIDASGTADGGSPAPAPHACEGALG